MEKPAGYEQEHKDYLDELRESGSTNMFGAADWLETDFDLTRRQAKDYLLYWMKTFGGNDETGH